MKQIQIGFHANPVGGPGIFLSRLQAELEAMGCFNQQNPDAWVQLCYEKLPEPISSDPRIRKVIRVDGVYSYRHHLLEKPVKISLPWIDDVVSRRRNRKRNRPIRQNLTLADQIVYQSEFSRQATWRFIAPTEPGVVIFNGVNISQFTPRDGRRRDPAEVNILVSHSFRPHKRLHEAVRIVAELKRREPSRQWRLHVVGGDDGQSIAYAKSVMQQEKLFVDTVIFHGKQPYDKLQEIYGQCDFVMGLSFWDFCPNVIVEALSCGLPVLGVNFGGIPELTGPAGRLVDESIPFDYLDLYDFKALPRVNARQYADEAMILLERLEEYQHLARQRALDALDIRKTARQYIEACEALL